MTTLQKEIKYALFATLNRLQRKPLASDEGDCRAKFIAFLLSRATKIDDYDTYKKMFPTKAETFNILRVIDMVEEDLGLFDDKDIQEQLHIPKAKKDKKKKKKRINSVKD